MDNVKESYKIKSATIIKNLQKRNMEGYYCETKEEAKELLISLIKKDDVVSWGGTFTIDEIGAKEALRNNNIAVIDRDTAKTLEERTKLMKTALTADVFLASTNAITMNGELVNIDGSGNRLAAFCYGPDSVIVVAGMNKVVRDVESAMKRVRTDACVPNAIRYNLKTPCAVTGICAECTTDETICSQVLVTRYCKQKNRFKVILVGEKLGF
nr:lactate utilization protein [Sedimentibacter sp.]